MDQQERKRLISIGAADDEDDSYPRICECCPAEFAGGFAAACAAGWRLGWDGWLCVDCMRVPTQH